MDNLECATQASVIGLLGAMLLIVSAALCYCGGKIFLKLVDKKTSPQLRFRVEKLNKISLWVMGLPVLVVFALMSWWLWASGDRVWAVILCWATLGLCCHSAIHIANRCSDTIGDIIAKVAMSALVIITLPILCYLFYWAWYYLCAGFLVIEAAESFWEQVVYGGITLIGVVFWVGLIMILLRKM